MCVSRDPKQLVMEQENSLTLSPWSASNPNMESVCICRGFCPEVRPGHNRKMGSGYVLTFWGRWSMTCPNFLLVNFGNIGTLLTLLSFVFLIYNAELMVLLHNIA